jgi:hypothetical protein
MSTRSLLLSVLVGSLILACGGRTDQSGSIGSDAGGIRPTATMEADASADATAAEPARRTAEGGAVEGAAASSRPCSIIASSYDQSCAVDSDCVAVVEVLGCGDCACWTGAINKREQARYTRDSSGLAPSAGAGICGCPCEAASPHCCGGVCTNTCGACAYTFSP